MNAKRMSYLLIAGMVMIVSLSIAGSMYGSTFLQKQADALVKLKLQSRSLDAQQATLDQAKQDIAKYSALNTIARSVVPQEKDQALTVRQLVDSADRSGISIGSITFPNSTLGQAKSAPSKAGSLSQVTPVPGIAGVYQMPITLQSDTHKPTSFPQLVDLLHTLENNRHTAQVGQLTITPVDSSGGRLSFQLIVNTYIKP